MSDLIDRKAILKKIDNIRHSVQMMDDTHRASIVMTGMHLCEEAVRNQPSAEPEIIRCKDCVHSDTFPEGADNDMPLKCLDIRYGGVMPDWYCEHAERRTDG